MKPSNFISYVLLSIIPLFSLSAEEKEIAPAICHPLKDRLSGFEYIKNLLSAYFSGEYDKFLDDMEGKYQRHPNIYQPTFKEDEDFFWRNIEEENDNNKQTFLNNLQEFASDHPESSLGKAISEFLSFSLSDEERVGVYFFSGSINDVPSPLIKESKTYEDLWEKLKMVSHNYKVKHAILNDEFLTSEMGNNELKAQHIILDIAMKEAIISFFEADSLIAKKIEESFSSYLRYLGFEYNSHYLTLLLNSEIKAYSENEIYLQSLIKTFKDREQEIIQDQLDWIEAACDGGYTEM